MGARVNGGGVNFALYSKHASAVTLALFDSPADTEPCFEFALDHESNRTGEIWHVFVEGLTAGQLYGFRVNGPRGVDHGHRFKPDRILLDPYARAVADLHGLPKSVVVSDHFDWQGVPKPKIPYGDTVIYETHVKGLTIHPSAGVQNPGTYRGVIEKIPYFKDLGITALELLPVHEFNHQERPRKNPLNGDTLGNYWGYSTIAFFAPKGSYSTSGDCGRQVDEFREMVRELHRAGIEIILDVVFNHTAELNHRGPLYNFRGIDNRSYYLLQKNKMRYLNLTGCGNTFYCNQAASATLIVDCLKYWYSEMGVDGFRFDLATVFNRDRYGDWWEKSPLLEWINNEPSLAGAKLISEPWDASGGYAVGKFGGGKWCDWNDKFRDEVRSFWRGDKGMTGKFATRLSGSQDLFHTKNSPARSINFITCHDGFTLRDLVSYKKKHNRGNGDNNRDGASQNYSMNFGHEGDTPDAKINRKRIRQAKNLIAALFLSQGVPMLLGGDEFFRTQQGSNNAYCQDNEVSWYDWELLKENEELYRFVRGMIRFRREHPSLRRPCFFAGGRGRKNLPPDISWYNPAGNPRRWDG
ncbi:MAG: glycogen-debranching protein, partial [FCB group bacterium]|nr:glycogen-debranching protein [FCB group bacterium]